MAIATSAGVAGTTGLAGPAAGAGLTEPGAFTSPAAAPPPPEAASASASAADPAPGAPVRRIVALAFDSPLLAQEALLAALRLEERGLLSLHDAVFLTRAADGGVEIIETSDPQPVAAAVPSSLVGALVGTLLAGPLGLLIGGVLGGGGGALAARLLDPGIPDRFVEELGALTQPGQTSLALLVSDVMGPPVIAELRRFQGARLVYAEVPAPTLEVMQKVLAGRA